MKFDPRSEDVKVIYQLYGIIFQPFVNILGASWVSKLCTLKLTPAYTLKAVAITRIPTVPSFSRSYASRVLIYTTPISELTLIYFKHLLMHFLYTYYAALMPL